MATQQRSKLRDSFPGTTPQLQNHRRQTQPLVQCLPKQNLNDRCRLGTQQNERPIERGRLRAQRNDAVTQTPEAVRVSRPHQNRRLVSVSGPEAAADSLQRARDRGVWLGAESPRERVRQPRGRQSKVAAQETEQPERDEPERAGEL